MSARDLGARDTNARRMIRVALATFWLTACGSDGPSGTGGQGGMGGSPTSTSGGGSTSTMPTTSTGMPECPPDCPTGLTCCDGQCVDITNDIKNCGACGNACTFQDNPFCTGSVCADPPCGGAKVCKGDEFCCADVCCGEGMLCCNVPNGAGGTPFCATPVNGTCPTSL